MIVRHQSPAAADVSEDEALKIIAEAKKSKPQHSRLNEDRLEVATRLNLVPVAHGISSQDEIDKAKREFALIENYFIRWRRVLESAVSAQRDAKDGLNDDMRNARTSYVRDGGLSAVNTDEQMEYVLSHGVLMKIMLTVQREISVTVGGVLMLSRGSDATSPHAQQRDQEQARLFPLYDASQMRAPDNALPPHDRTAITLRSVQLPTIQHAVDLGLTSTGKVDNLPLTMDLQRLGLPAAAKGALVTALGLLSTSNRDIQALRSIIGEIGFEGRLHEAVGNSRGRGFNDWMKTVGFVRDSISLDSASGLRLFFRILMANTTDAHTALLGPEGIASGKGHSVNYIEEVGLTTAQKLADAIKSGAHAEL